MASSEQSQQWTILSLQNWCVEYLKEKEIDSPKLTTDLLLCHVLKCKRIDLYSQFEKMLSKEELAHFKELFKRKLEHEPIQYITNEAHFMGLRFYVDKRVLIPRPETEILVSEALTILKSKSNEEIRILDIGTGSGNIPISIAHFQKNVFVDSIDISDDALSVAQQNVDRHEVTDRVHLKKCSVMNYQNKLGSHQYDMLVSNPPYISNSEFEMLSKDVKDFEPHLALNDEGDGLTFYKAITNLSHQLLKPNGWLLFEVAYNQSEEVKSILHEAKFHNIEAVLDLERIPRVIKAQKVSL
ncbi:MAG: peptide chain release factor N(5)-glutamine methyltransferase [Ignavibacteriae bacterium]|nr:peptide chain release factor N(5)-glutamine methyltransferase [Ignavibacteriota bacterium]